ncbi:MAG: hypothetical protein QOF78_3318 [Phycisphaerales bacterium]|jgi:hypothetical protein|nr:hypothetical protein [Phycisphaerales bacterium]
MTMTWEAFRLTSKSPTEVLHILGPHGVDDLVRKAMDVTWREYPEETRTFDNVKKRVQEVFARNMRHWSSIKKPTPAAFFDKLLPYTADGYVRQAMVLTWMMMPRAGGRDFKDTRKIISRVFERNLEAWDEDHRVFTDAKKKSAAKTKKAKPKPKKPAAKKKSSKRKA